MAHGESDGADGGAGEALDAANQATGIAGTEVEEDVRGGDAALPWLLGSGWTRRTMMRSSGIRRGSEGVAVAAAVTNGGDDGVRPFAGEGNRGEGGVPERERDDRGGSRPSSWRREGVGEAATAKQEVAGVGARASSTQLLRALAREEDRRRGPGGLGRWGSWAGQVSR